MRIRQDDKKYNLGANIRRFRKERHLTQEQTVAKMQLLGLDISRGTYSQIECGIVNIRVEDLLALRKIFGIDIGQFFDGMDF